MGWVLRLIETGAANAALCVDVMEISCSRDVCDISALGLTLPEGKQLLARVRQAVIAAQAQPLTALRPDCSRCEGRCDVNKAAPSDRDSVRDGNVQRNPPAGTVEERRDQAAA